MENPGKKALIRRLEQKLPRTNNRGLKMRWEIRKSSLSHTHKRFKRFYLRKILKLERVAVSDNLSWTRLLLPLHLPQKIETELNWSKDKRWNKSKSKKSIISGSWNLISVSFENFEKIIWLNLDQLLHKCNCCCWWWWWHDDDMIISISIWTL